MKKSYNLGYYLSEGFRSIFTHGLTSFAAACMIVACLVIMGSFSLVVLNLEQELSKLEQDNQFLAFVDENYTRGEALALKAQIEAVPNVAAVLFETREEAQKNYAAKYASDQNAALYSELPAEVFRDRYAVHVEDLSMMQATVDAVEAIEGIEGHQASPEVAQGFVLVRNVAAGVAAILIVLLLFISGFIIYNTIRLGTFSRREEITIMKMCGATHGFVRGPLIFEGMILGLLGAVLAFFCQWGVYQLIAQAINTEGSFRLFSVIPFREIWPEVLGTFAGAGLVVGTGGSVLAIRKFLNV